LYFRVFRVENNFCNISAKYSLSSTLFINPKTYFSTLITQILRIFADRKLADKSIPASITKICVNPDNPRYLRDKKTNPKLKTIKKIMFVFVGDARVTKVVFVRK
jgi:peroxiredoxin